MKIIDIIKTSNANLLRTKLRTILTLLALIIGAITLSLTLAVGEGVKSYIDEQSLAIEADDALIIQGKSNLQNPFDFVTGVVEYEEDTGQFGAKFLREEDSKKIKEYDEILEVYPSFFINTDYIRAENSKKYMVFASSIYPGMIPKLEAGDLVDENDTGGILIPLRYVEPLGFTSPEDSIGKSIWIRVTNVRGEKKEFELKIKGVLVSSLVSGGTTYISVDLTRELYSFQTGGSEALADNYFGFYASLVKNLSEDELNDLKTRLSVDGYESTTYDDQIKQTKDAVSILQVSVSVFGGISILAATFGIVNTLLMGVIERTREIGLMKALGMRAKEIFYIFAFEAVSIGFWGGLLGIFLSLIAGTAINAYASENFLKSFEGFELLQFNILNILLVMGINMTVGFLAGTLPAIKASRLDPIQALRYE